MAKKARPPPSGPTLLDAARARGAVANSSPLADRMRPRTMDEIVGQSHLLARGKPLRQAIDSDRLPSLILWGPPGAGKTTLAHVISHATHNEFVLFSAVLGGVPELREIIAEAKQRRAYDGRGTSLFIDEIHR